MIVCVDTNVLVQARAINHAYGPILDGFALGTLSWAVSVRVMLEYEEIIRSKASAAAWETVLRLMNLMEMNSRLLLVSPHFQFHVIGADPAR